MVSDHSSSAKLTDRLLTLTIVFSWLIWFVAWIWESWASSQWGWLVAPAWLAGAGLLSRSKHVGLAANVWRRRVGVGLVLCGLGLSILGALLLTVRLGWLGVVLATTGVALIQLGIVPWTRVLAICSLIWVACPLPFGLGSRIENRLHGWGLQTANAVFDLLDVPVHRQLNLLDFRARQLDSSVFVGGVDNWVALALVAVLSLVVMRRPLLVSVFTMAAVPFVVWLGQAAKVLLWYWGAANWSADWSTGWALVGLSAAVFAVEVTLILLVNWGCYWAFQPVLSDPNAKSTGISMHGLYNVVALWPLQVNMSQVQEDRDYLEDFEEGEAKAAKQKFATRRLPNYEATKNAVSPWADRRLRNWTLGLGITSIVLTLLATVMPAAKVAALPVWEKARVNKVATAETVQGSDLPAEFVNAKSGSENGQHLATWNFAGAQGSVALLARFPSRYTEAVWMKPAGLKSSSPVQLVEQDGATFYEVEFSGALGGKAIGWFGVNSEDGSAVAAEQQGWWSRIKRRLSYSLVGRFLPNSSNQVVFETALIAETSSTMSERMKRQYRAAFAKLNQQIVESLRGPKS